MSTRSPDDAAILLRLTRTILSTQFAQAPVLVAGRVPDGWPPDLVPPPPVSTLGGMSVGNSLTAVFRYPPDADAPFAEYRALLDGSGWAPPRGQLDEGFDSTSMAMFCRESSLAILHRAQSDPADNSIMVSLSACDGLPCHEDARFPHHGAISLPRLLVVPGVRWDSGGGSSGGGNHRNWHIRVTTELFADELLPLYAKQLAEAGWHTGAIQATPAHAIQWLEATDERKRVWRGMLAVYVNDPAREVFIYMATASK